MPGVRRCHETVAGVMHDVTVDLSGIARRVLIGCVAIEVALVVLDYHVNYGLLVHHH